MQGTYDNSADQQVGYQGGQQFDNEHSGYDMSNQQQGYEDVTGQENGFNNSADAGYTVDTPHAGGNSSSTAPHSSSDLSRGSACQGLQAQGEGFGQGFNQGFGQGLSGDPDGSQPHDGVHVQEDAGPGHASKDTDVVGNHVPEAIQLRTF